MGAKGFVNKQSTLASNAIAGVRARRLNYIEMCYVEVYKRSSQPFVQHRLLRTPQLSGAAEEA